MSTTPTPVPAVTTAPTANDHARLDAFLKMLLMLSPIIAAPFVPAGQGQQILQAETPVAEAVAQALPTV